MFSEMGTENFSNNELYSLLVMVNVFRDGIGLRKQQHRAVLSSAMFYPIR